MIKADILHNNFLTLIYFLILIFPKIVKLVLFKKFTSEYEILGSQFNKKLFKYRIFIFKSLVYLFTKYENKTGFGIYWFFTMLKDTSISSNDPVTRICMFG